MSAPWVSMVVATRNDDYGGNLVDRTSWFVRNLAWQSQKHGLQVELVIVEWNPPSDRPRLREVLNWPERLAPLVVRIIEVPGEFHQRLPNADRMPIFDCPAKNVGIRRARGRFVLVTNPDVLFNSALIEWMAAGIASTNAFYRADRIDFRGPLPETEDPEMIIAAAKKRAFVVHLRQDRDANSSLSLTGFQGSAARYLGWWPSSARYSFGCKDTRRWEKVIEDGRGPYGGLHTNGAGDFLMASREAWHSVNGIFETTDTFSHVDSYAVHQLHASGLQQRVLVPPCLLFHMDHDRSLHSTRPQFQWNHVLADLQKLRSGQLKPQLNGENWGLPDEEFVEILLS